MSIRDVDALYCSVDAFWQVSESQCKRELLADTCRRGRADRPHPSELVTIAILFQRSGYRTSKAFSIEYVQVHLRAEFSAPSQP